MNNLILCGHKSVGKSYFGKLVSQRLEIPFIETDKLVEEFYYRKTGGVRDCRSIFMTEGSDLFRALESLVVASLVHTRGALIALGGGTLINLQNRIYLSSLGKVVYLSLSQEILKKRSLSLDVSFEERSLIYEQVATEKVQLDGKEDLEVVEEIAHLFR